MSAVNAWSSWSNSLNQGFNLTSSIQNQTSSTQKQLADLVKQYKDGTITASELQTQSKPIITNMDSFIDGLSNQYAALENSPGAEDLIKNLNTAWETTKQTFGNVDIEVTNPAYPLDSNQPTIPVKYNSDGTVTVSFTAPYNHNDTGGGCYLNGVQNLSWLPEANSSDRVEFNDGTGTYSDDFSLVLSFADDSGPQTCTYNGETIQVASNGNGTMTITITGSPASFNIPSTQNSPSTSALSDFLSKPFGN